MVDSTVWYNQFVIKNQQIDKISELFLDISKGLFLAALAIRLFTTYDIITFWMYMISAFIYATLAIKVLERKKEGK